MIEKDSKDLLRVLIVGGVRPQFIKCAALKRAIDIFNRNNKVLIQAELVNTGQHYDDELAGALINELDLDFNFTIQHDSKNPVEMFGKMISQLGAYLQEPNHRPDWVIIFGDANTSLASALAATKVGLRIAHFEAGTAVRDMPTVEVINGKLLAHLSNVQLCSSDIAAESLRNYGIREHIYIVGDIAHDFVLDVAQKIAVPEDEKEYVLVTIHHEENLRRDILVNIFEALSQKKYHVTCILHPRTRLMLGHYDIKSYSNIEINPSLGYSQMLAKIKGSRFLLTDSGGLQREAYYLKKRCIIRLDVDYWPELTRAGVHKLIESNVTSINSGIEWVENVLKSEPYPLIEEMELAKAGEKALRILSDLSFSKSNSISTKEDPL